MEAWHRPSLTRRRLIRLGTLTVGGVIAAASTAGATAIVPGPGQDGAPPNDPRFAAKGLMKAATAAAVPQSYNGWPVGRPASAIGVRSYVIPGTSIPVTVRSGDVATVMMYLAGRFNTEVEKLRAGQIWGYEYRVDVNNPKWWSCHASGTAIDLNAVLHPNNGRGTFSTIALKNLRKILADCNDVIYWGGDFSGVPDPMHFEINVPPGDSRLPALAARIQGRVPPPVVPPIPPTPPVNFQVGQVFSLRSEANNKFVTADISGRRPLIAGQNVTGGATQYQAVKVDANHIALRARANNRFVSAERAGTGPLIANREVVGLWETFTVVRNAGGTVSLKAAANGRYVTAEGGGTLPLIANRTVIGPWEKFAATGF